MEGSFGIFFFHARSGAVVNAIGIPGSKTKGMEGNVKENYE